MKYEATAVLKLAGYATLTPGETVCQKSLQSRQPTARYNADLIIPFGL